MLTNGSELYLVQLVVNFVKFTKKTNRLHLSPSDRRDSGKLEFHPGPKLGGLEIRKILKLPCASVILTACAASIHLTF